MVREIGIGLLGAGFIGQMHSLSFGEASRARRAPPLRARLAALTDRDGALAEEVAQRYGWAAVVPDWRAVLDSPGVEIFVDAAPNDLHAEPCVAAAARGIHLFCEKPLARTADEAFGLWQAASQAGVVHRCAFLHRHIPALRLARQMIAAGELGEIRHFRSSFLLDMRHPGGLSWRYDQDVAGGGASGDLGSHHIDQARYLVGEVSRVAAMTATRSRDETGRVANVNDDWFGAMATLDGGATAVFEASRLDAPHALTGRIEVDGTLGSLSFSMERLNELSFREPGRGPRTVMALGPDHPYADFFLPVGVQGSHPIGWRDCFAFQAYSVLQAVAGGVADPDAATFADGYRVAETVDAVLRAARTGQAQDVRFRNL